MASNNKKKKKEFSFEEWSNANHGISKEQEAEDEKKRQAYLSSVRNNSDIAPVRGDVDPAKRGSILAESALSDPEFKRYSDLGASVKNPSFSDATKGIGIAGWRPFADEIQNPVTYVRENEASVRMLGDKPLDGIDFLWANMTEEEVEVYNYYLAKDGKDKAEEYLKSLKKTLSEREGKKISDNINGKPVAEVIIGGLAGVESGVKGATVGMKNLVTGSKETMIPSPTQYADRMMAEDNTGLMMAAHDTASALGNMTPSLAVGLLNPIAGAATMGISVAGNKYNSMIEEGYDTDEAQGSAIINGIFEGGSQYLMGGIGKLGGKGASMLFSKIAPKAAGKIGEVVAKVAAKSPRILQAIGHASVEMGKEATEEALQTYLEPLVDSWVTGEEFEAPEFEDVVYSALLGAVTSGILEGAPAVGKATVDTITGNPNLTADEQSVADRITEYEIARREKAGETLTSKEKKQIAEAVQRDMDKGNIPTEAIEAVLGGESYKTYRDTVTREDALRQEYEELGSLEKPTLAQQTRYQELHNSRDTFINDDMRNDLRSKAKDEVRNRVRGTRLEESYLEADRKKEKFTADFSKYKDENERKTVENIVNSGLLDNTNKSHEIVDFLAKTSKDRKVTVEVTNNEKLKAEGKVYTFKKDITADGNTAVFSVGGRNIDKDFKPVVTVDGKAVTDFKVDYANGKITFSSPVAADSVIHVEYQKVAAMNGSYEPGKRVITFNVDSEDAIQTTIGHELKHSFEGTEFEDEFNKAIVDFAKKVGTYDSLVESVKRTYYGADEDTIKSEVTAILTGEYITTDEEFVKYLSTNHRNVFEKIYDEIKHWLKMVTAGSKEARALEKAKHIYAKMYRAEVNADANVNTQSNQTQAKNSDLSGVIADLKAKHAEVYQQFMEANRANDTEEVHRLSEELDKLNQQISKAEADLEIEQKNTAEGGANGKMQYSLYLTEEDIPDYLKAGTRRNKNRQARYDEGQKIVISSDAEFESFVKDSINGKRNAMAAYGKVDDELARQVKTKSNSKIDISGAYLELLSNDVDHAYNGHEHAKEDGDMDMSVDDLIYALKNVNQSEVVSANQYNDGSQRVMLAVPTEDGMMLMVEVASKSAGTLRLKTSWKVTADKFAQKNRNNSNSAGSTNSIKTVREDAVSDEYSLSPLPENVNTQMSISSDDIAPTPDVQYSVSDSDGIYFRMHEAQVELGKLERSIKEIENSTDFKDRAAEIFSSKDDISVVVNKYQQLMEDSGHSKLTAQRDALKTELENLRKEFNDEMAKDNAETERKAIEKSGLSEADYFRKQAVKQFGYTPSFVDAGYIVPNGKMLNFSGEKGKHFGTRGQDHRAIGIIYETSTGTDAMYRFMRDGNIRIMESSPGIDLSTVAEPTKEQYATIKKFIYEYEGKGYFNVDLTDESGKVVGSLTYENRINPTRIINDIKHYYETGEVRQQSAFDKFSFSLSNGGYPVKGGGTWRTPARDLRYEEDIAPVASNTPTARANTPTVQEENATDYPLPDEPIAEEEPVKNMPPMPESDEDIIKTVKELLSAKITNSAAQLEETKLLRDWVKASYENKIEKLQTTLDSKKNKDTKVAIALRKRIANLKRVSADVDADIQKRISDIENRISKTSKRMEDPPRKDILEVRYERIDKQLEEDKIALKEDFDKRKVALWEATQDKPAYISNKALDLYNEVKSMRKGVRVSGDLGYLLDNLDLSEEHKSESYKRLRQALIDIKNRPNKTVNQYSEIESIAREMLNASYEDAVYNLDDIDSQYQAEVKKLEAEAEAQKEDIRKRSEALHRADVQRQKLEEVNSILHSKGFDLDEMLDNPDRQLSTLETVDTMPQRVMEKTFGYEAGQALADATVNKIAQNETAGLKWLDSITNRKNGLLAQLSKQYDIKPHSKEIAAAMMYGEGSWVDEKTGEEFAYGDAELAKDFPDVKVQNNIKALVRDPRIRQFYDETLDAINESRKRNGYPEIPRRANYFLHYRELGDFFTKHGLPFNPNDARAKDLPTDMVGRTADLKPGQPFFTSSWQRKGKKTSYDLFEGMERYANSAKNQIYHIDDIQTLRALHYHLAERFGQAQGLENLNKLTPEEASERIKMVYGSHLSTFAAFLDKEANILAGKTAMMDRGFSEEAIGRRFLTFMDALNKHTGATMVGYNISSANTNWLPVVREFANSKPVDSVKALAQTVANIASKGKFDSFREDSTVYIRRQGADRFNRKLWQKLQDPAYALMGAVDSISTEIIARTEYNKAIRNGMNPQEAHYESDKKVSRLMADRSLGQMPQIYTSRLMGLVTKFQLEVRNDLDSMFYDTLQEEKISHKDIENARERNAKIAAKVAWRYGATAIALHMFGQAFEAVAGYNPAFDIIEAITKAFGWDDEEDDEDTWRDNLGEGAMSLLEDLPYASIVLDGGRIPISSAIPDLKGMIEGKDEYGNDKSFIDHVKEIAPYMLPAGGNQIKKTYQGLKMFSDEHPVSGSYTDSGNLRFPVEDTPLNRAQAAIFGQYASKNAREYFDNDYAPLNEKQIREYIDVDMPISDYWKYREGLKGKTKAEETLDYISGLDLPMSKKNILANNALGRKDPVDLTNYEDFGSLEEFDFATKSPDKYAFAKSVGGYSAYKTYSKALDDLHADKDANGKSIKDSRKEKVINYINNLDADYYAKIILYKSEYPSDDTYNYEIVKYINDRSDLTYEERVGVLTQLGFRVTADGKIYAE